MTRRDETTSRSASVIVCTRNRAELLAGCLETLLADPSRADWELVVVDNASTDDTAAVVAEARAKAPDRPVEYIVEERLGLSHARNRGIAAAGGDHILFTDDDVLVEPGWVDALLAGLAADDVAAVAGRIVPEWPFPPPAWLEGPHAGVLALTDFGEEARDLAADEVPVGANMAIRRSLLEGVAAPFDPRLGHQGTTFFAYEEHELFLWVRERGRLVYRPDAVVRHRILPERMTWSGMRRAIAHNGFGSRHAERLRGASAAPWRKRVPMLLRTYVGMRRRARWNGGRPDVDPHAAWEELRRVWNVGRWIREVFGGARAGEWFLRRLV